MNDITNQRGISLDLLERAVPSIFATEPDRHVSEGYSFIPTRPILDALVESGWVCTSAKAQLAGRGKSTKVSPHGAHMLRFRRADVSYEDLPADGHFEILMFNSHDRTKRYQLSAGVYRMICSNGLIVASHMLSRTVLTHYHVRHSLAELVSEATALAARSGMVMDIVESMRDRVLTVGEQLDLARKAIDIRYRGIPTDLRPETLLNVRREEDAGDDLWHTFNRVQENMIVGGVHTGRRHTRPMVSLYETNALNTQLWVAAEKFLAVPKTEALVTAE